MSSRIIASLILVLATISSLAQTKLPDSERQSANCYVYKIDEKNLQKIHLKDENPNEGMLQEHLFVTSFPREQAIPQLERGNYLIVKAEGNRLAFRDHVVDDLFFKILPGTPAMLCLYDSLGRIINNAVVKKGRSLLKFDPVTQTYNTKKIKNEQIIEIDNNGVFHYIEVEKYEPYYYRSNIFTKTWRNIQSLFDPDYRLYRDKYTGFIVFSKPKYKPGETVKFKAYMTKLNGTPYNKSVNIKLYNYRSKTDTTLIVGLAPYRPGMYQYEFKLSDSLNLKLDNDYSVILQTKNKEEDGLRNSFRYEDYELKSVNFSIETAKEKYAVGDTVKLKLRAMDENNMAVYGGRVEIVVTPVSLDKNDIPRNRTVFIRDTLWKESIPMTAVHEKEIAIPDSLFPKNTTIDFHVKCTYLSTDNEKITKSKRLTKTADDFLIDFSLKTGMLSIKELHKGIAQQTAATITVFGEDYERISKMSVMLPYELAVPWYALKINVDTENTIGNYFIGKVIDPQIGYAFYPQNDSIYLRIDNPANIPFWYVVRKGNKDIAKGYNTQLIYACKKEGQEGYSMQLKYIFGERTHDFEAFLPFTQKNMTMEVETPTIIYPGQKTTVSISVVDKKGKPVENADITAYSFTSKFQQQGMPNLTIWGKTKSAKAFEQVPYKPSDCGINSNSSLTWDRWKQPMSLDTIAYYKFLYPDVFYSYTEPTTDGSTLIAPYVVINGAPQGIHLLWIDNVLYYAKQAQQLEVYTFKVAPGLHSLRFRTSDREIIVNRVEVKEGAKNIFSFDASSSYSYKNSSKIGNPSTTITSKLLKKKERGVLSQKEVEQLTAQLITVNNVFGTVKFPSLPNHIERPTYISTGNINYFLNPEQRSYYNHTLRGNVSKPILAGPFPVRSMLNGITNMGTVYVEQRPLTAIQLEGGYDYTLYGNFQKMKSWETSPINKRISHYRPVVDFKTHLLTPEDINDYFFWKIKNTAMNGSGAFIHPTVKGDNSSCNLQLYLGDKIMPYLIWIAPVQPKDSLDFTLYFGGTRNFNNLAEGEKNIYLIFEDTTSYRVSLPLFPNGKNYLRIDTIKQDTDRSIAKQAYDILRKSLIRTYNPNPYNITPDKATTHKASVLTGGVLNADNLQRGIVSGIVKDMSGEPIPGATIVIAQRQGVAITDINGYFELAGARDGDKVEISSIGYETVEIFYTPGYEYTIVLEEAALKLEEVVVVGYGVVQKKSMTGSVADGYYFFDASLQGAVAGVAITPGAASSVKIRGISSIDENTNPLIIVDGLPYAGKLEELDHSAIISMNVLKDASLTAVYGARAAGGVIIIQTNKLNRLSADAADVSEDQSNSMRRNFHDDAFWQPSLRTDKKGKVSFEVIYPDDITSWQAYFLAIGNRRQTDKKQLTINSFKALTARLSTPHFAVRGDRFNAVGRMVNHNNDSIAVTQTIAVADTSWTKEIGLKTSFVEQIPARAENGDSLTIAYSLQKADGYFDGEERKLPIIEQGLQQAIGEFKIITDTATMFFTPQPELGATTLYAEASSLEIFLREIDKIDQYPYYCNEQMASKIKALLLKKRIYTIFGKPFKEDKKIINLINRLNNNRNSEGLWGWWNKDKTAIWISKQVVEAMLAADDAGYKTGLDKEFFATVLEKELKNGLSALAATTHLLPFAKQELLDRLILLKQLNAPVNYYAYYVEIEERLKNNRTTADKLKEMLCLLMIDKPDKVERDTLMHYAHETLLGTLYWGDNANTSFFRLPHNNNTSLTLMAYNILKRMGNSDTALMKIRNYFFESRRSGFWQNTYEASRIIETILPDMMSENSYSAVSIFVNGRKVNTFPHTEEITAQEPVAIKKNGTLPLYVTLYQKGWAANPAPELSKGFVVKTHFNESRDTVAVLTAGTTAKLAITVTVKADAEYVQIEVPIPAGCSYDSKKEGFYFGKETYREHFKEKIVIFCEKLTQGEHLFTVDLLPRYTGKYILNPAKVELMYFPIFYGNEEVKQVEIVD